ncbi:hypothetical protein [uncultured Tateyamaria sp.]|uniref:hypothetical protein n=1 Tax=uncultured Tateyamaria sp. TaxID=455651 RepID=UPI00261169FF|nr:hypothetical protein [uncultured Tateyamaria sp.]
MRFTRVIAAAAAVTVFGAVSAMAQGQTAGPKIYSYHSTHNYCPAGLQPVTMDGKICCGRPNQSISYQQALAHAVAKKKRAKRVRHVRQTHCPVGTKGCTFD